MVDLTLLQSVSYIAGALGVCVAAFYYVITLRTTLQTRNAQIMMDIFDKWNWDKIFQVNSWKFNNVDEFMGIFNEDTMEKGKIFNDVFAVYEETGVLLHENLIDIRPIARGFGGFYKGQWEKWEPYIKHQRVVWKSPRDWIEAEYFYDRLMRFARDNPEYRILEHETAMPVITKS
ncbi:MAG: hypothetical protein ABSA11_17410 [Candidatus Bathyarchaeia archaeon]|jgi:hypothetical protein